MKHGAELLALVAVLALPHLTHAQQPKTETKDAPAARMARLADIDVRTTTSADGVKIRYMVAGLKQAGAPIVLVHGFSVNRSIWEPHFSTFARSHPVVAVDLAGFGESGADRAAWTMKAYGQDLLAVLKDLDLRGAVLVGYSMGAGAVLEAGVQDPARILGVVLVDWLHDPEQRTPPGYGGQFLAWMQRTWRTPALFAGPPQIERLPDSLVARYEATTPAVMPAHWRPIADETFRWANDDLVAELKAAQVAVAAINSDQVATNVVLYRQYVPSFQLRLMPRLSHAGVVWQETALFDRHLENLIQGMEPGLAKAAPTPPVPQAAADVRAHIEQANARLEGWYRTGQIDSVASYFAVDARQMASGAPPVGREAIRAFWSQATRAGEWNFTLATQEVSASGEMAAERGLYSVRYTPGPTAPKELSAPTSDHGRYLVLWRKGADGRWRISWDAAVSDVAPPAPVPPTSAVKARAAAGALASVEGVFEYVSPLKGLAIAQAGRFSFVHGPADGSQGVNGYGGTYMLSGDTAAGTVLYSSDPAVSPGFRVRWIHRQIAGDTLQYEYVDSAGRTSVGGTVRRIAPSREPEVGTKAAPAVAPDARATGGAGVKPTDSLGAEDVGRIRAMPQRHIGYTLRGEWDRMNQDYAPDVRILMPGQPEVVGLDALRKWQAAYPPVTAYDMRIDEVDGRSDLAYARLSYHVRFNAGAGEATDSGRGLWILRKGTDGRWRVALDITQSDPPAADAPK